MKLGVIIIYKTSDDNGCAWYDPEHFIASSLDEVVQRIRRIDFGKICNIKIFNIEDIDGLEDFCEEIEYNDKICESVHRW